MNILPNLTQEEATRLLITNRSKFNRLFFFILTISYTYFFALGILGLGLTALGVMALFTAPSIGFWLSLFGITLLYTLFSAVYQKNPKDPFVYELKRNKYPDFFESISDLESQFDVKIKKIVINHQLNAFARLKSRFFFFGSSGELQIGLPLLLSLSKDEFRSIMAHELGHISRKHGRITSWSYKTYYRLLRLVQKNATRKAKNKRIDMLINPFFSFIWPRLSMLQFTLGRQFEFDVDGDAASITGVENTIKALTALEYANYRYTDFWKDLNQKQKTDENPPENIYQLLSQIFRSKNDESKVLEYLDKAIFSETKANDTHPAFKERIDSIRQNITLQEFASYIEDNKTSAYADLIKDDSLISIFSKQWTEWISKSWAASHKNFVEQAETLKKDIESLADKEKTLENIWPIALRTFNLYGYQKAESLIEEVLKINPDHQTAIFYKFRHAIDEKNKKLALELGERLIVLNIVNAREVLPLYAYLFTELRDKESLDLVKKRSDDFYPKFREYLKEISHVKKGDLISSHSLSVENIAAIKEIGIKLKGIKYIKAVAKRVDIFKEEYVNLLILVPYWFYFSNIFYT